MNNILVTDGRSRASLVIPKFLKLGVGREINVLVGEDRPIHLSFLSKYSDKKLTYRKFIDDKSYLSYFIKLIKKEKIDMIIPIRDDFTNFFSKYKIILSKFANFLVPDFDSLKVANNKKKLSHFCLEKGFSVPKILNSKELSSHLGIGQKAIFRPSEGSGSRGITVEF